MTNFNDEASPIARMIGPDGKRTVGWVYVWESSELSILWLDERKTATFIEPEIRAAVQCKTKTATPEGVVAFLCLLRKLPR